MEEDILVWLWRRAAAETDPAERLKFMKAAEVIETLRTLVDIRGEVELEGMEPEGRA